MIVNIIIAKYFLIGWIRNTSHIFRIANLKVDYYKKEKYRNDSYTVVNRN